MSADESNSTRLIQDADLSVMRDLSKLRLQVIDGPDAGRACDLGPGEITVGTDPACDLVLADDTVSRRHFQARKAEDGVSIRDLDSSNGTYFMDSKVKEIVVGPGATLRAGQTLLKVVPREKNLRPEPVAESDFHGVLGQSVRMREIFATLTDVAGTDLTLLIEGETGTGKEALAEAVHSASPRADRPFVVVDCTTIPRDLAESELFGHKKGAFTGAVADRRGSFEQAHGGTVFIDEVADLPAGLQPKLLRALERHQFRPVGGDRTVDVNVRVIAATNKSLKAEVERGGFREDLYYRMAVVAVQIPPLRERAEDLPLLMEHFLAQSSGGKHRAQITSAALLRFVEYPWPGNVRELRNVTERAVALHKSPEFDLEAFLEEIAKGLGETSARRDASASAALPFKEAKSRVVDAFERAYLTDLIQQAGGNVSSAAREARLDRHHLKDLLKKHGIKAK
ncbi:sigma 54-interacting transcriptional regulator [Myxococcota bacterium]